MTNHIYMPTQQDPDIDKHLKSLKTRLGFARFKLRNGWERNTLLDVEGLWKERQRQVVDALPIPRFTQRDILDNKSIYAQRLAVLPRHPNKQVKRAQLIRSLSTPAITHHEKLAVKKDIPPRQTKSSLDDLSYAIALTECRSTSPCRRSTSPRRRSTSPHRRSLTPPMVTAPSSPVQAAAEAMMLIGHSSQKP